MATTTASAGRVLLMDKGEWVSGTAYELLDFVYYNGSTYVCKAAVTSTTTPDTDTDYWQIMAYGFDPTAFTELKAMITPDDTFTCTIDGVEYTSAQEAIDALNSKFDLIPEIGDAWDSETAYTSGDLVIANNTLYKAITTVPAGTLVTDTNYWEATTVAAELESHATDIATNATNIATNASDISTLNSDTNTIETATAIDLSTIYFYRVGKLVQVIFVTGTFTTDSDSYVTNGSTTAIIPEGFRPLKSTEYYDKVVDSRIIARPDATIQVVGQTSASVALRTTCCWITSDDMPS